jgi:homospermidine synthase
MRYCCEYPEKGALYPEAVPSDYVMKLAEPYLGKVYKGPVNWTPKSTQFCDGELS